MGTVQAPAYEAGGEAVPKALAQRQPATAHLCPHLQHICSPNGLNYFLHYNKPFLYTRKGGRTNPKGRK